jgi:hypothetical protein
MRINVTIGSLRKALEAVSVLLSEEDLATVFKCLEVASSQVGEGFDWSGSKSCPKCGKHTPKEDKVCVVCNHEFKPHVKRVPLLDRLRRSSRGAYDQLETVAEEVDRLSALIEGKSK